MATSIVAVLNPDLEAPAPITHSVRVSKFTARSLIAKDGSDRRLRAQVDLIITGAITSTRRKQGWDCALDWSGSTEWYSVSTISEEDAGKYKSANGYDAKLRYDVFLVVSCTPIHFRSTFDAEFGNALANISAKASPNDWVITLVDGKDFEQATSALVDPNAAIEDLAPNHDMIGYAPFHVPEDFESHFTHLYGLEAQISLLKKRLVAAEDSDFGERFNFVMAGPPGCGKTAVCKAMKKALGDEAVMEFDGTSTTMVGAQKQIAEREILPRVLVIEEIEKAPAGSLAWILSLGDSRAEIKRVTARGNLERDAKMVIIATVNDMEMFKSAMSGALGSRFPLPCYFRRPSRAQLSKILEREIKQYGGDLAWIEPTLTFAQDEVRTSDPREVIAICMTAKDSILTGEFQFEWRATCKPEEEAGV